MVKSRSRRALVAASIVMCAVLCPKAEAAPQAPSSLTVEQQAHPLAVENLDAGARLGCERRRADRVRDPRRHRPGEARVPGRLGLGQGRSSDSTNVAYAGPALTSSQRCGGPSARGATKRVRGRLPPRSAPPSRATGRARRSGRRSARLGADYSVDVDFTVDRASRAGVKFRASGGNSFMWQVRGDSSNELRPHVQVNGTYTPLKAVQAADCTIGLNTKHHLTIPSRARRSRPRSTASLVDTTIDTRNPSGVDRLPARHHRVRDRRQRQGHEHGRQRRSTPTTSTPASARLRRAARSPRGVLSVPPQPRLHAGLADDWAFLRHEFTVADKEIAWATAYVTAPLDRARAPVRLQALAQRLLRRRRPDAREEQHDDDDVQRLRRHGPAAPRRGQRARRARLHRRPTSASWRSW